MKPLKVGEIAPPFIVNDHLGNPQSLESYKGSRVVIFFYPKANTPGCTAEACDLRDHYKELKEAGYVLLGVSADTELKQKKFADKFNLPFPLLADTERTILNSFGVWGPKKFMGKEYDGIHRMTFILDENGVVERVIEKVKTKEHATQILEMKV
jgi:peroxiredoxin Q/BCP